MKKLRLWIRKNLKLVAAGIVVPTLALSGCASVTPVTKSTVTAATASTVVTGPTKAAYVSYFEACSSYGIAMLGVKAAIANGTIKPASFPEIIKIKNVITPICQKMPVNLSQATVTILDNVAALEQLIPTKTATATSPTASTQGK